MIYCFDTSALNRLHDDPDCDALSSGILSSGHVLVTSLNVIEVTGEKSESRRRALLELQSKLAKGYRPLAEPNELLRRQAVAFAEKSFRIDITSDNHGLLRTLKDPSLIDEVLRQKEYQWKKTYEDRFKKAHREGRAKFDALFKKGLSRPRSASFILKEYWKRETFLFDVVRPLYSTATKGLIIEQSEVRRFLLNHPSWLLYLSGWALSAWDNAIRINKMGIPKGKMAGTLDLACSVYLPYSDLFITADGAQRRALKILNRLLVENHQILDKRISKVISYETFRDSLILPS